MPGIPSYSWAGSLKGAHPLGNFAVLRRAYVGTWLGVFSSEFGISNDMKIRFCSKSANFLTKKRKKAVKIIFFSFQIQEAFLKVLADLGIFLGTIGIYLEMLPAGLRDGYPLNSQEYPCLKPSSTIFQISS